MKSLTNFLDGLTYRSAVFARDGLVCSYCAKPLAVNEATVDHVEPLARGGRNHPSNMVVACSTCNGRKGCLTLTEFLLGEAFDIVNTRSQAGEKAAAPPSQDGAHPRVNILKGAPVSPKDRLKKYWKRNISNTRRVEAIMRAHGKGRLLKPLHLPTLTSKLREHPALRALISEDSEIESERLVA